MTNILPKVSVIIPVYNAADYLYESLNDVVNQSYPDFEIICVNDGSTDKSQSIIEEFQKKDNRIKLIVQSNRGGGAARNVGFDKAEGEYVLFLDADDRFETTLINDALNAAESSGCDVLIFNADEFHYETHARNPAPWLFQAGNEEYNGDPFCYTTTTVWNKLYRRDYLLNHHIRHQDERVTAFSMYFTFFALVYTSKISFLDKVLVHYRSENPKSSMRRHDNSPMDTIYVLEAIWNRVEEDHSLSEKKAIYLNFAIKSIFERTGWFRSYEAFSVVYDRLHNDGFYRIGLSQKNDWLIENKHWINMKNSIIQHSLTEFMFFREAAYKEHGIIPKTVYLLPEDIRRRIESKGCKVVIYGAGMVGKCYFPQLKSMEKVQVVSWVDERYKNLGFPIQSPEVMKDIIFDYIIIAVDHNKFLKEIEQKLSNFGIAKEKMIWEAPKKQL